MAHPLVQSSDIVHDGALIVHRIKLLNPSHSLSKPRSVSQVGPIGVNLSSHPRAFWPRRSEPITSSTTASKPNAARAGALLAL